MSAEQTAIDYICAQRTAKLPILIPVLIELTNWTHSQAAKFVQKALTTTPELCPETVKMPSKAAKYCEAMQLPTRRELF